MPRIVAGTVGGRRIDVPPGTGTRPTADRAREALFATLGTLLELDGARVLDLYAGSGALGLEACSRGAASVLAVESDRRAAAVIRANASALGLDGVVVRAEKVRTALTADASLARHGPVDLVLADPPYATAGAEVAAILELVAGRWLAPGGVVMVERSSRGEPIAWPAGIEAVKSRRYGEATLWYGRAS